MYDVYLYKYDLKQLQTFFNQLPIGDSITAHSQLMQRGRQNKKNCLNIYVIFAHIF